MTYGKTKSFLFQTQLNSTQLNSASVPITWGRLSLFITPNINQTNMYYYLSKEISLETNISDSSKQQTNILIIFIIPSTLLVEVSVNLLVNITNFQFHT